MDQDIIHVYFMPGMAASPKIFEYIKLPEDSFKIHYLNWIMPESNEPLENYAKRMCRQVEHENIVLLGVSFGGIVVQEMSKILSVRKLLVVSSVVSKHQLPKRMKFARLTKAYKIMPTQLLSNAELLSKYAYGEFFKKRIDLYRKYLAFNNKEYLDWSIEQVVNWSQEIPPEGVIQIHGEKDGVFTNSCNGNCIVVKGGTHIMIINKFKWFNENLPKLLLN